MPKILTRIFILARSGQLPYLARRLLGALWAPLRHARDNVLYRREIREVNSSEEAGYRQVLNQFPVTLFPLERPLADYLSERYCNHQFDLLGTGWIGSSYDLDCSGLEGNRYDMGIEPGEITNSGSWLGQVVLSSHLPMSQKLWQQAASINPFYQPIDWQRDRKSGFRWNAKQTFWRQVQLSHNRPGVDLKQPLELGRLQHLPQLALVAGVLPESAKSLWQEYQCQLLDFAAANPVGMGVSWSVSMDAAIRVCNICMAHWLFQSRGMDGEDDQQFNKVLIPLVREHGRFIFKHLETNYGNTGNHFLSNLVGLLFASYFLKVDKETKRWQDYALREFIGETRKQFYEDGGNFEASSCYHAFATEMLVFAVALICGAGRGDELPGWLYQRLSRALDLVDLLTNPAQELIQFGDNDSGRLFKLLPRGELLPWSKAVQKYENLKMNGDPVAELYFDENALDYSTLGSMRTTGTFFQALIDELSGHELLKRLEDIPVQADATSRSVGGPSNSIESLPHHHSSSFTCRRNLLDNLQLSYNPSFQVHVFRSDHLYLAISAHTNKQQKLNSGHTHNDKLAIELYLEGKPVLVDPGSYLYTPLPSQRNRFRATTAHNTLQVEGVEQNRVLDSSVLSTDSHCELLEVSEGRLVMSLTYQDVVQVRTIDIQENELIISDSCSHPFRQAWNEFPWYSNGYGKLIRRV